MKGSRSISFAALLLLAIAPAVNAQQKPNESTLKFIVRSETKNLHSRRNLIKILRNQPGFWIELQAIAKRLKTQPAWLLNVMASESLFDPAARNPLPGQTASGLLQFIEKTAQSLGTTTEAIRRMSPIDQLPLVEKYLAPFKGRLNSQADVYLAVFRGFLVKGDERTVIAPLDQSNDEKRKYILNQSLDLDHDGRITKGELALAAVMMGGFQPASSQSTKNPYHDSAPALDQQSISTNRQTHSIYIRSPKPMDSF